MMPVCLSCVKGRTNRAGMVRYDHERWLLLLLLLLALLLLLWLLGCLSLPLLRPRSGCTCYRS